MLKISENLRNNLIQYIRNTPVGQFNGNTIIELINQLSNLKEIERKPNENRTQENEKEDK